MLGIDSADRHCMGSTGNQHGTTFDTGGVPDLPFLEILGISEMSSVHSRPNEFPIFPWRRHVPSAEKLAARKELARKKVGAQKSWRAKELAHTKGWRA